MSPDKLKPTTPVERGERADAGGIELPLLSGTEVYTNNDGETFIKIGSLAAARPTLAELQIAIDKYRYPIKANIRVPVAEDGRISLDEISQFLDEYFADDPDRPKNLEKMSLNILGSMVKLAQNNSPDPAKQRLDFDVVCRVCRGDIRMGCRANKPHQTNATSDALGNYAVSIKSIIKLAESFLGNELHDIGPDSRRNFKLLLNHIPHGYEETSASSIPHTPTEDELDKIRYS